MIRAGDDGCLVIGVIADDFTSASGIAGIPAREGARTVQVVGVPGAAVMRC